MNITFTTVALSNANNVTLDDLKMAKKVSVICDENLVPILENGFPVVVQQVKEFRGKITHGRLVFEDNQLVLPNMKSLIATSIQAVEFQCSMDKANDMYLAKIEANKAKPAKVKKEFAKDASLFEFLDLFKEMGIAKYSFRNPEKLKDTLKSYIDNDEISKDVKIKYWNKLKSMGFSREQFCSDYVKYLSDQKMVQEGTTEDVLEDTLSLF